MVGDLGHGPRPAERLLSEHRRNEMRQRRRKIGPQRLKIRRAILVLHLQQLREVVRDQRRLAGQHFEQHDAEAKDVAPLVARIAEVSSSGAR